MDKKDWYKRIKKSCEAAGTYQPFFDDIIDTLAQIMEARDKAHEQYVEGGSQPTVIHVNKAKESNVAKNPALTLEMDLNMQALAYWKQLGLTPKGFREVSAESLVKVQTTNSIEKILEGIAND